MWMHGRGGVRNDGWRTTVEVLELPLEGKPDDVRAFLFPPDRGTNLVAFVWGLAQRFRSRSPSPSAV